MSSGRSGHNSGGHNGTKESMRRGTFDSAEQRQYRERKVETEGKGSENKEKYKEETLNE